jgi:hypothetical protein
LTSSNYAITFVDGSLTINKALLTVTASSHTVSYGDSVPTITPSYLGFVNLEDETDLGTQPTCTTTYTDGSPVSGSPYATSCSDGIDGNYSFGYVAGTVSVNKADATVVVTPYNVTYNGLPHTATYTITGVNGETGATVGSVTLNTTHTNAGTYSSDTWSFTGAANYNNIASTTITDTINKADATVVVTPYNVTYNGLPHTATITSITGVNGETGATVGSVNVSGTTHTLPGTYNGDPWSFTGTANYNNTTGAVNDLIGYATCSAGYGPGGVILQPINSDGTSVYARKGGSTIPVKFTVCDASGMPISNPSAVFAGTGGQITMLSAVRGTVTAINEVGAPIDVPDVAFRWAGDKWIFNMATTNLTAGMTYTFRINLLVGNIQFKVGVK